jgi:hypothetical protein
MAPSQQTKKKKKKKGSRLVGRFLPFFWGLTASLMQKAVLFLGLGVERSRFLRPL